MRKENSKFLTGFLSEEGSMLKNRDYFAYVELDQYACYVAADSLDEDKENCSAMMAVKNIIQNFMQKPSMTKHALRDYMNQANQELNEEKHGMRLKASVILIVTDYVSIRCCHVGNCRFLLLRGESLLFKTNDQSLTNNLMEEERLALDKAALHEERNNLYAYLGQDKTPEYAISKKMKMEDGDIFALYTRGVWEHIENQDFLDAVSDAKEPQEVLDAAEELILSRQQYEIDNYTLAITFVNKIYRNPKKKFPWKVFLMTAIPILIAVLILGITLFIRHRNRENKIEALKQYMMSGEEYFYYDNYKKASEEYDNALAIAKELKMDAERMESDKCLKLSEQIQLADESILAGDYRKAQEFYLKALTMSYEIGNVGRSYIESQLELTRKYTDFFDYIESGEQKEEYGDYSGAIEMYKLAKEKAGSIYYRDGKQEALEKLAQIEELLEKQKQKEEQDKKDAKEAEEKASKEADKEAKAQIEEELKELLLKQELEEQAKRNDQQNAMDLEIAGNKYMADGDYESALTYFKTAQSIYQSLQMDDRVLQLKEKINAAQELQKQKKSEQKKSEQKKLEQQAEGQDE